MTMARATVSGVLTAAPEKRFTNNNVPVTTLQVMIHAPAKRPDAPTEQYPVRVVCWRQLAEQASLLQQGQTILIEGRLQLNAQTTPEGMNKKSFEIDASAIYALPSLPEPLRAPSAPGMAPQAVAAPTMQAPEVPTQAPAVSAPQPAMATAAPQTAGSAPLSDLTPEDFMEDDIPF